LHGHIVATLGGYSLLEGRRGRDEAWSPSNRAIDVDGTNVLFLDMTGITYTETTCKSALNRVRGMPFSWSLNPYRGCTHSCHYCYARATHAHLGLNADEDFETRIVVKTNFPEILRAELGARSWRREKVAIGTATDPYQPCEGRYRLTRRVLQALVDYRTPASIVTKSTLVLRDLDFLVELEGVAGARVNFTITTLDRELWRAVEPGTPPPAKRLEVLRRLVDAGVPCGVYLAPILPGLTDSAAAIDEVAAAAREHGATRFWAGPLRLAPLVKEHYLGWLEEFRPELLPRYQRAYPRADAPRLYKEWLDVRIAEARARHGFLEESSQPSRLLANRRDATQLALAL
jgi:DNA repair photolyase